MAFNAYAQLTANGNSLTGETTMANVGEVDVSSDHIEVYAVDWGTRIATADGTTRTRSPRVILPVRIMKRVDRTTPLFHQALVENHAIAGKIKFFDTGEDGSVRHHFTLTLGKARLASVQGQLRDVLDPVNSTYPALETIEIQAQSITYRDEVHSTQFKDG